MMGMTRNMVQGQGAKDEGIIERGEWATQETAGGGGGGG